MSNIWNELGIEPTSDRRRIKKAYAEAVKTCHPEEHPEAFQRLYEAYQAALNSVSAGDRTLRDVPAGTLQQGTLPPEVSQQKAQHSEVLQQEISQTVMWEETLETARSMQMIFARNDQQKQNAWEQLMTLWDSYLAERNRQNAEALIQFLKGTEFPCIRDLDDTMQLTMLMAKYMATEDRTKADDKVLCALCDIYVAKDTASDEFDPAHLEDSARRELSAMLRNERERRVQMRQQKRERNSSMLFKLILYGGLAGFIVVTAAQALYRTTLFKREKQCKETVIDIVEHEYPQLRFGDVLGEWEIMDGDTENTYIITTEVRTKSGMLQKGSICVEAERDQEGNITIISEKFTGIEID